MKLMLLEKYIRYLAYKFGISVSIPAKVVNMVPIKECGEPLVDLRRSPVLLFDPILDDKQEVLARKSVCSMLEKASYRLPENHHLKIHSAYRPRSEQMRLWNRKCQEMRELFPDLSEEEIYICTQRVVADPRVGFGGHQTGGAIDLTLCDDNGIDYNMGCRISDNGNITITHSKAISEEVYSNRMLLLSVLTNVGFVNYPKEWWHFCYGDRMWAVYKNKKNALYGEVLE